MIEQPLQLYRLGLHGGRKGYRYGNPDEFYDVFWRTVSDHYVILEEFKTKKKRDTCPLEVYEGNHPEESIDERCLTLLKDTLKRWKNIASPVENAVVVPAPYKAMEEYRLSC